jgi:phosphatidylserine decarboxylase
VNVHRSAAFLRLYGLLPHRWLNRAAAALTAARHPRPLVDLAIAVWRRVHSIDLHDFEDRPYGSVDDFFLRRLRPGARPLGPGIVSPADGRIVDGGAIALDRPMRVKEQRLSVHRLVNGNLHHLPLDAYDGGAYAVVFLTPHGYHRVHMPCDGEIVDVRWIPGRFFPQNEDALRHIPRIHERNERAVLRCRAREGDEFLLVMVGASLVGGIRLEGSDPRQWMKREVVPIGMRAEKGKEIGHFAFGSTVVVMVPRAASAALAREPGGDVRMGETLFHG